uniref:NTR domain-containing protein n=1 Tax=Arion vulgaris TaxID=1028688 RepID=A0A0B6ZQG1_9EUPU
MNKNQVRSLIPVIEGGASCNCDTINSTQDRYLLMGNKKGDQLSISFGIIWNRKDKEFKKGINAIRKENKCEGIFREISSNGIETKSPTSKKVDKTKKTTENKNKKNDNKNIKDTTDKTTKGKKGKKGKKEKKGKKGKGKKNNEKMMQTSPNTTYRRENVSKSEMEDRALSNFMRAGN